MQYYMTGPLLLTGVSKLSQSWRVSINSNRQDCVLVPLRYNRSPSPYSTLHWKHFITTTNSFSIGFKTVLNMNYTHYRAVEVELLMNTADKWFPTTSFRFIVLWKCGEIIFQQISAVTALHLILSGYTTTTTWPGPPYPCVDHIRSLDLSGHTHVKSLKLGGMLPINMIKKVQLELGGNNDKTQYCIYHYDQCVREIKYFPISFFIIHLQW